MKDKTVKKIMDDIMVVLEEKGLTREEKTLVESSIRHRISETLSEIRNRLNVALTTIINKND